MGRKRNDKKVKTDGGNESGDKSNESLTSTPKILTGKKRPSPEDSILDSSGECLRQECEKTNAENIVRILELLETLQSDVKEIRESLHSVKTDVQNIQKTVRELGERCTRVEGDARETNNRVDSLKSKMENQDKLVNDLFTQVTSLKNQSLVLQHTERKNNILFWNVRTDSLSDAKNTIKKVLNEGLEIEVKNIPPFSVVQEASNFIKIKVTDYKDRYGIMKNAKKLRGKDLQFGKPVFISDDVSREVRQIRKELVVKRKYLMERGVECWIPPVVPPVLSIKSGGNVEKVEWFKALKM